MGLRVIGDNYNPIRVAIEVAASLWNRGLALLGLGQGDQSANAPPAPGSLAVMGLNVRNRVDLWVRAFLEITGSNYAPIDIEVLLVSDIANVGVGGAQTSDRAGASTGAPGGAAASGSAACLGLVDSTEVGNSQHAVVKTPPDGAARKMEAANTNVLDLTSRGAVRCTSGDATGSTEVTSGAVRVDGNSSTLDVTSHQKADTSVKQLPPPTAGPVPNISPVGSGGQVPPTSRLGSGTGTPAAPNATVEPPFDEEEEEEEEVAPPVRLVRTDAEVEPDTETTTSMAGLLEETVEPIAPKAAPLTPRLRGNPTNWFLLLLLLLALIVLLLTSLARRKITPRAPRRMPVPAFASKRITSAVIADGGAPGGD